MNINDNRILNVSKTIETIKALLLAGYSPIDLMDERLFYKPYSTAEVWAAIMILGKAPTTFINSRGGGTT